MTFVTGCEGSNEFDTTNEIRSEIMRMVSEAAPKWMTRRKRSKQLVEACLEGNEEAWVELWEAHAPLVKAVARRTGCDADEAADVLQRVALVAIQRMDRLREPEKLPGWLAGVSRYQAMELIRQRRPFEQLQPWLVVDPSDPGEAYQSEQEAALLHRALLEIDDRCRRMIHRLDLKDPPDSYKEVAESENLAPSSIGPVRRRCLRRLKKIIDTMSQSSRRAHFQGEG